MNDRNRPATASPLKHWRIARKLSQKEAAQLLGVSTQTAYSSMELGDHFPNVRTLREMERRGNLQGLVAAYVVWFYELTENEIRTVLMAQATSGVVLL